MKIAISGTPATGKTSVAIALSKLLGWELIELNQLAEEKELYCGHDEKRDCKIVDVERVSEEVKKIEKDVVIEAHYAHDISCDVIVILHTNPAELRERMKEKGWSDDKIEENVEAEIMNVCKEEARSSGRPFLDFETTKKSPEQTAREIQLSLKRLDLI